MNIHYRISDIYYKTKTKIIHWYQKLRYGVSDSECWNLNSTIAKFVLPRLIHFKKMKRFGHPADMTNEAWEQELDEMIFAFDFYLHEEKYIKFPNIDNSWEVVFREKKRSKEDQQKINDYWKEYKKLCVRQQAGFKSFARNLTTLWD